MSEHVSEESECGWVSKNNNRCAHSLTLTHSFIRSLTHSLIRSLTHSLTHTLTHSHTHTLIHTHTHTHSLTHSLTHLALFTHILVHSSSSFPQDLEGESFQKFTHLLKIAEKLVCFLVSVNCNTIYIGASAGIKMSSMSRFVVPTYSMT